MAKMAHHNTYAEHWVIVATAMLLDKDIVIVNSEEDSMVDGSRFTLISGSDRRETFAEAFLIGRLASALHYMPVAMIGK